MIRPMLFLISSFILLAPAISSGDGPQGPRRDEAKNPEAGLPMGKWTVTFANGVVETCEIRKDATASVVEPLRSAAGKVTVQGQALILVFEDDRTERWTPVGDRFVVEHWFPSSQLPVAAPVLGIAERGQ